jgi:GDP-4-dehydro-6-deoxy-D-mannose reductase
MTARALIVGGTGFVGAHLARQLSDRYAVTRSGRDDDVRDRGRVRALVQRARPDIVVNLASLTTVRETFDDPRAAYEIGLFGLLNLLDALKGAGFRGTLLQVSSSELYGFPTPDQLPLTEATPLSPQSPYSVAKIAAEALCHQWNYSDGIDIRIARPFTHIGPGQSVRFSVANFARQVAEIMAARREPVLRVGQLTTTRDLSDVRDVARAYDAILHQGTRDVIYNVCSGRETAMRAVVDEIIRLSGRKIEVLEDQGLVRKAEQQRLLGCHDRLTGETGWRPEIALEDTLSDILLYFVRQVNDEPISDR